MNEQLQRFSSRLDEDKLLSHAKRLSGLLRITIRKIRQAGSQAKVVILRATNCYLLCYVIFHIPMPRGTLLYGSWSVSRS